MVPGSNGDLAVFIEDAEMRVWDFNEEELSTIDVSTIADAGKMRAIEVLDDVLYVMSDDKIHYSALPNVDWQFLTDVDIDDSDAIITSHINSSHLYMGTLKGPVYAAALSGGNFELLYQFDNRVRAFYLFDDGVGFVTIQSAAKPMKTTDGGVSWANMDEFGENAKLYAYDSDKMLTANTNRFYVSTDGGASTTYVPLFDNSDISLIQHASFAENGDLYLVGRSSTIIKSTDVGLTYENLNDYNRSDLYHISFDDTGRGVAAGGKALFYSNDDGDNWASFDVSEFLAVDGYINSAALLPDNTILVGHNDGHAFIKDGALLSEAVTNLDVIIHLPASGSILAITDEGSENSILKSTDNGASWTSKHTSTDYSAKVRSTAGGKIYYCGSDGYLISEDDGETWEKITPTVEGFVSDMHLFDDGQSIFSISGELYESPDAGVTMTESSSAYALNNLYFLNSEHYIFTQRSSGNTTLRQKKADIPNTQIVETMCGEAAASFLVDNTIWLSFRGGHIKKFEIETSPPNAVRHIHTSPLTIHPNPAYLGAELQFSSTFKNTGHLQISNQLGQVIFNDANFSAASLQLSSSRFAAGSYFISLLADGQQYRAKLVIVDPGF